VTRPLLLASVFRLLPLRLVVVSSHPVGDQLLVVVVMVLIVVISVVVLSWLGRLG
jgi:hypothetical protein